MSKRFAVYLTPEPEDPLWQFGSSWLGYDADSRTDIQHPILPGLSGPDIHEATSHPRAYGLHVTIKAPFRLAQDVSVEELELAVAKLASRHAPIGPVELTLEARPAGEGQVFLCLAPRTLALALHALEADAVTELDVFRAPLSTSEIARRKPDSLPQRERRYLEKFGYPFVLDAFRPHISLTGPVRENSALHSILAEKLTEQPELTRLVIQSIVLLEQPEPGTRFHIRQRFSLGTGFENR